MKRLTPFCLLAFLILLVLLPLVFGAVMAGSLAKLHLRPGDAVFLTLAIFTGSLINIPVRRIPHDRQVETHPLAIFGLQQAMPRFGSVRRETVIAVNVGGCVIPTLVAIYEAAHLAVLGPRPIIGGAAALILNIAFCDRLARPVPGVGILLPGLVPGLAAALMGILFVPAEAAPVAFIAGVMGPLIGADLFHLKEIEQSGVGVASIGGAGTFDGIVLSGIIAAYLA